MEKEPSKNVLGGDLIPCSMDPMTGFFRNGSCDTCAQDQGSHTVCAIMDKEFLMLSQYLGNDLSTPRPEYGFQGLKPGDHWCLCAGRFLQAYQEGCAPKVVLETYSETPELLGSAYLSVQQVMPSILQPTQSS